MKQFFVGAIITILVIVVAILGFRGANQLISSLVPTPSPVASTTPSPLPSYSPIATPQSSTTPTPFLIPTTKGGIVKGATTTKKVTTTTTTSHLTLTLIKTSVCPISYTSEVKDITGPLTLRYELIDNTSFGITIWNKSGEELLQNTTYSGRSGTIKNISGVDYMKVRVESKTCTSNNDNWLKLTAER